MGFQGKFRSTNCTPKDTSHIELLTCLSSSYGHCLLSQPRCAEPWTEVIFESPTDGKVVVIVSPLVRLTNKAKVSIEDIGTPEGLLVSLGPFITGEFFSSHHNQIPHMRRPLD